MKKHAYYKHEINMGFEICFKIIGGSYNKIGNWVLVKWGFITLFSTSVYAGDFLK